MTLSEFKAWFDGFTESMDSTPNVKQWKRIKERVGEIDDKPTTYPVFVNRYRPYWAEPYWVNNPGTILFGSSADTSVLPQNSAGGWGGVIPKDFDSHSAMLDLGKAEFQAVQ